MSKLTQVTKVYRGISGMKLPNTFRARNEFGVRGGIEAAFLSTTANKQVAMGYTSGQGVVFEVQMGMVDRGAQIQWLSQYPHEEEILFGPLSGLEVLAVRMDGAVVVVEAKLSINLTSLTLEQVIAKRRKVVQDMCGQLLVGVEHAIDTTEEWSAFFEKSELNKERVTKFLKRWLDSHSEREEEHYNDDESLGQAIDAAVQAAKCVSAWPSTFKKWTSEEHKKGNAQGDWFVYSPDSARDRAEGIPAALLAMDKLQELDLKDSRLSTASVVMAVEAVQHSHQGRSLLRLDLTGNEVDVRGARTLGGLLGTEDMMLRELILDNLMHNGLDAAGIQAMSYGLQSNASLRILRCVHA